MKITNDMNLPQAFVSMAESDYTYKDRQYSVTSLLKGVREAILSRRHHEEIEQDVSDMVWMLWGQAVHHILEHHKEGDYELKEEYLKVDFEDYILSGRFDLYNDSTKVITDYKTASVWKVIYGDFDDWRQQGLLYAFMLRSIGFDAKRAEFVAFLKDHSKKDAKYKSDYPKHPVFKIGFDYTLEDFAKVEQWLKEKFEQIRIAEALSDSELPLCSPEERWYTGDKYAVMKKGRKTAMRVLDSEKEAQEWMEQSGGEFIEHRPGVDKKCMDYCAACAFCDHYVSSVQKADEVAQEKGAKA